MNVFQVGPQNSVVNVESFKDPSIHSVHKALALRCVKQLYFAV